MHTRKVCHQNRSLEGAKTHAIFLSLFRTAQLEGLNPVDYAPQLAGSAISGEPTDPIAPRQLKIVAGSLQTAKVTRKMYLFLLSPRNATPALGRSIPTRFISFRNDECALTRW